VCAAQSLEMVDQFGRNLTKIKNRALRFDVVEAGEGKKPVDRFHPLRAYPLQDDPRADPERDRVQAS